MQTRKTMTSAGQIIEVYTTKVAIQYGYTVKKRTRTQNKISDDETIKQNALKSSSRSRSKVKWLLRANYGMWHSKTGRTYIPAFLTLTFRKEVTSLKEAKGYFSRFEPAINYYLTKSKKKSLKYLVVPEIQTERKKKYRVGVWHFHIVLFNFPYLNKTQLAKIKKLWPHGSIYNEGVKTMSGMERYLTKYLTKQDPEEREINQKRYFCSRGLFKPKRIMNEALVTDIENQILKGNLVFVIMGTDPNIFVSLRLFLFKSLTPQKKTTPLKCCRFLWLG